MISGVKRPDQLADNLVALDLVLTHDDMAQLDEVSRLAPSYPGWIQTYNAKGRVPQGHPFDGPIGYLESNQFKGCGIVTGLK